MQRYHVTARSSAAAPTVYSLLAAGASWPTGTPIDAFELECGEAGRPPVGPQEVDDVRVFRLGRQVTRERVVELVPHRRMVYVLLSGGPLRDYRATVELTPDPAGGTHICWQGAFRPPVPGVGWFLRWYMQRYMRRFANGLATHADALAALAAHGARTPGAGDESPAVAVR
jgi:hypothetical protein